MVPTPASRRCLQPIEFRPLVMILNETGLDRGFEALNRLVLDCLSKRQTSKRWHIAFLTHRIFELVQRQRYPRSATGLENALFELRPLAQQR